TKLTAHPCSSAPARRRNNCAGSAVRQWAKSKDLAQTCGCLAPSLLRQNLHEADAARDIAAKEDAVWVGRIDVNAPRVGFSLGQREFHPLFGPGVETGDLVNLMLADPDITLLLVHHHRIVAAGRGRRRVEGHLLALVVDLH